MREIRTTAPHPPAGQHARSASSRAVAPTRQADPANPRRDVEVNGIGEPARAHDTPSGLASTAFVEIGSHDVRTLTSEKSRHGFAHAGRGSGDEHNLA